MKLKPKARPHSRLSREMLETAKEMHALGIMDDQGYAKITMRDIDKDKQPLPSRAVRIFAL